MKPDRQPRTDVAPDVASKIGTYADSILRFGSPIPFEVDLRRPLTEADRAALDRAVRSRTFGIVTACNPEGRVLAPEENRLATAVLARELEGQGLDLVPAEGGSPDGPHREPGFAVALEEAEVVEIAIRHGQDAIFWFDGERFWIVAAKVPMGRVPLPLRG